MWQPDQPLLTASVTLSNVRNDCSIVLNGFFRRCLKISPSIQFGVNWSANSEYRVSKFTTPIWWRL